MFKSVLAGLLLAAFVLIAYQYKTIFVMRQEAAEQKSRYDRAKVKFEGEARSSCAKQAASFFQTQKLPSQNTSVFSNHYNTRWAICFVEVRQLMTSGRGGVLFSVFDAHKRRVYANYRYDGSDKGPGKGTLVDCSAEPPGSASQKCQSLEEYYELAKQFMQN